MYLYIYIYAWETVVQNSKTPVFLYITFKVPDSTSYGKYLPILHVKTYYSGMRYTFYTVQDTYTETGRCGCCVQPK